MMKNATVLSIAVLGCVLGCSKQPSYEEALQVFTNEAAEMERLVKHKTEGAERDKALIAKFTRESEALLAAYAATEPARPAKPDPDMVAKEAGFVQWLKDRIASGEREADLKKEDDLWKAERVRRGVPQTQVIDMKLGFLMYKDEYTRRAAESAAKWDELIEAQAKRLKLAKAERDAAAKRAGR